MSDTPNLRLPYLAAAQAQKHVTVNETLRTIDVLIQLAVEDRDLGAPPTALQEGARYIVATPASGAWAQHEGEIAAWQDGAWSFHVPKAGWQAYVRDEDRLLIWNGSAWTEADVSQMVPRIGVNATANDADRLTVKSDATLFSHDDVTPGSGDHRLKINKATASDTASMLFQVGYSGRAEFGLTGDDDWHVKVSADGATWREALLVDRASGRVTFPQAPVSPHIAFNLLKDAGRFAGSPEPAGLTATSFSSPPYLSAYNGSVLSAGDKFIHNNTTYGGSAGNLGADVDGLIQKLRDTNVLAAYGRYGVEFYVLNVTAGSGTAASLVADGTTHYLVFLNATVPLLAKSSVIFNLKVRTGAGAILVNSLAETYRDGVKQGASFALSPSDGWRQIAHRLTYNPRQFYGYDTNVFRVYATPGAQLSLALPIVFPGWAPISAEPYGAVASLEAWR